MQPSSITNVFGLLILKRNENDYIYNRVKQKYNLNRFVAAGLHIPSISDGLIIKKKHLTKLASHLKFTLASAHEGMVEKGAGSMKFYKSQH